MMRPVLYVVIPCYNEEKVLPITTPIFLDVMERMIEKEKISSQSRILFVNDGSKDNTWELIKGFSESDERIEGISLSRNRGHQNALLAGLEEAKDRCDITITIDCDGQDDPCAMERMVDEYLGGAQVVYGVRNSRKTDSFFKRTTARGFYRLMRLLGAEIIYDHADYRLMSSKVLCELFRYGEVNVFLRGMIPLIGFKSTCVSYDRDVRKAGKTHYPLKKMVSFALGGITSLSVKPIRYITAFGFIIALLSFVGLLWSVIARLVGDTVQGWASLVAIVCFLGGVQLTSIGIIGEYVGKIYMEVKHRPRYSIEEKTNKESDR